MAIWRGHRHGPTIHVAGTRRDDSRARHRAFTLYLAGQSTQALGLAQAAADFARSSRDTTFIMYPYASRLNLAAAGRYTEATQAFHEARSFGRNRRDSDARSRHGNGGRAPPDFV